MSSSDNNTVTVTATATRMGKCSPSSSYHDNNNDEAERMAGWLMTGCRTGSASLLFLEQPCSVHL